MLFGGAYLLWERPLVIAAMGVNEVTRVLQLQTKAMVLYWPAWFWTVRAIPQLLHLRWQAFRNDKQLHFMCNSPQEDRMLRSMGLRGRLVSLNCYPNEHVFDVRPATKNYDAVYIAQMSHVKRLALAAQIPSLYVVTYGACKTPEGENDLHRYEPAIAHADFNRGWASHDQVVDVVNRSRTGLALSASEGAMLAAVEYMLCGVPLVSTPCRGGRELFFDQRFASVVEPTAEAVAEGVREMIARNLDPHAIRAETLRRIQEHRDALCSYVEQVLRKAGSDAPTAREVHDRFFGSSRGTAEHFIPFDEFASRSLL